MQSLAEQKVGSRRQHCHISDPRRNLGDSMGVWECGNSGAKRTN